MDEQIKERTKKGGGRESERKQGKELVLEEGKNEKTTE